MKRSTDGMLRRPFAAATATIRSDEPDRQQPEQVEPSAATDAHTGRDALHLGDRARPRRRIDDVLARRQLRPEAPHRLRRDPRRCRRGRVRAQRGTGPSGRIRHQASTLASRSSATDHVVRAGRERRSEKRQQGETGLTFVGHAQLLIAPVEGEGTRREPNRAIIRFENSFTFHAKSRRDHSCSSSRTAS